MDLTRHWGRFSGPIRRAWIMVMVFWDSAIMGCQYYCQIWTAPLWLYAQNPRPNLLFKIFAAGGWSGRPGLKSPLLKPCTVLVKPLNIV